MDLYIDIDGVLLDASKRKKLFEYFFEKGYIPKEIFDNLNKIKDREKAEELFAFEINKTLRNIPSSRKDLEVWLDLNLESLFEIRESIENFKKRTNQRVLINSGFNSYFKEIISKKIHADGYTMHKSLKGYLIDDNLRFFKREYGKRKEVIGSVFALPRQPEKGKQKQLMDYGMIIKPKSLAELISMIRKKDLVERKRRKKLKQRRLF